MATKRDQKTQIPAARLYRSENNRIAGGVAAGLGEYTNMDATIIRLIFILLTVFGGSGVIIYLVLWLIIPAKNSLSTPDENIRQGAQEIKDHANKFAGQMRSSSTPDNSRLVLGVLLIGFGLVVLLGNFGFFDIARLWPIILIIVGLAIISGR